MIHERLLKNLNYILFSLNRFEVLAVRQMFKKVPLKTYKSLCINTNPYYYSFSKAEYDDDYKRKSLYI